MLEIHGSTVTFLQKVHPSSNPVDVECLSTMQASYTLITGGFVLATGLKGPQNRPTGRFTKLCTGLREDVFFVTFRSLVIFVV